MEVKEPTTPVETAPEPVVSPADLAAEEREAAAAFEEGFAGTPSQTAPPETPVDGEKKDAPVEAAPAQPPAPATPEYVQVTKQQLDELLTNATEFKETKAAMEKLRSDVFGRVGGVEGIVKALQTATPAGEALQISEEDFEEMRKEFPELTKMQVAGLNRALAKVKLKGTASAAPAVDEGRVSKIVQTAVAKARLEEQVENWEEIVGPAPVEGQPFTPSPYRVWLATQTPDYQKIVQNTWDPKVLAKSIEKFQKDTAPKPPATPPAKPAGGDARRRLESAVPPKGTHATPPGGPTTEADGFLAGFKEESNQS